MRTHIITAHTITADIDKGGSVAPTLIRQNDEIDAVWMRQRPESPQSTEVNQ